MKKLKALFKKGFMKLTKGHQLVLVKQDEVIVKESELALLSERFVANKEQKLEKKLIDSYQRGLESGLKRREKYTLLLPSAIKEENKHLTDIVSLIASELLDQGDSESCIWLLKKLYKCNRAQQLDDVDHAGNQKRDS